MERRHGTAVRGQWHTPRTTHGVHGAHGGNIPPDVAIRLLEGWSPGTHGNGLSNDQVVALAQALHIRVDLHHGHDAAAYLHLRHNVLAVLKAQQHHHALGSQQIPQHAHTLRHPVQHRGHAPAAPPPEAQHHHPPPAHEGPAPDAVVHCRVTALDVVHGEGHEIRRPSAPPRRVLQLVPTPDLITQHGFSGGSGFNENLKKDTKTWKSLLASRRHHPDFESFMKGYEKHESREKAHEARDRAANHGHNEAEQSWKVTYAHYEHGVEKLKVKAEYAPECGKKHPIKVTGAHPLSYPGNEAEVPFHPPATGSGRNARPDVHNIEAHGCEGRTDTVRVEVFPSEQYIFGFSVERKREVLDNVVERVNDVMKHAGAGSVEVSLEGGVEGFFGWRNAENNWRVYYASELALKGGWGVTVTFKLSLVSLITHIPSSLLDFIGDVGLSAGLKVGIEGKGAITARHFPGSEGEGAANDVAGEIKVEGKGSLPLEVYAHIGATSILGASASGRIEPGITVEGKAAFEEGNITLGTEASLDAGDLTLSVLTKALWWERRKDWKFNLWNKHTLFNKKFPLYNHEAEHGSLAHE